MNNFKIYRNKQANISLKFSNYKLWHNGGGSPVVGEAKKREWEGTASTVAESLN